MATLPCPSTMDLFAGIAARDAGIDQATASRNELVNKIRAYLEVLAKARTNRCVTADDFGPFLESLRLTSKDLGNAAGGIFKHPAWEFTGTFTPSKRKSNNARFIRVWRLK